MSETAKPFPLPVTEGPAVAALLDCLGKSIVLTGDRIEERYKIDWSRIAVEEPAALLLPRSIEDVSTILSICNEHHQAVSPQGGRTGLNGSAAPRRGEIVLSLEGFAGIEEFDQDAGTMLVRSGTTLETIQSAAEEGDWMMALDLGARGSCQIGGNISTNAGGNRVLRYGMTRDMILGLEAVLADGTVISNLSPMIKNNAGYNLKHLFIGSEGTLGVVTRARLRLFPKPRARVTALISSDRFDQVIAFLKMAGGGLDMQLSSFEVMWNRFYRFIAENCFDGRAPMPLDRNIYVLIETHGQDETAALERMEQFLADMLEADIINDAIIAQSERQRADIWAIRDRTGELAHFFGDEIAFDIGVPLASMEAFIDSCKARLKTIIGENTQVYYGHLGDSNLHLNLDAEGVGGNARQRIEQAVYDELRRFSGTITAEHGVGFFKRDYLNYCRSDAEIALMQTIKAAMDPNNILNPGRIFEMPERVFEKSGNLA